MIIATGRLKASHTSVSATSPETVADSNFIMVSAQYAAGTRRTPATTIRPRLNQTAVQNRRLAPSTSAIFVCAIFCVIARPSPISNSPK